MASLADPLQYLGVNKGPNTNVYAGIEDNMNATWRQFAVHFLVGITALFFCACGEQRCQAPAEQAFPTFINQQWRLVSTTDPATAFQGLNNYNTLIFQWNPDFSGDVYKLQYNTQLTAPALTFVYQASSKSKIMQVQYNAPSSGDTSGGSTTTTGGSTGTGQTTQYSYELSNELHLTDANKGYTYRFVPFNGIVLPDQNCKF